jgi:hypothetical protein
MASKNWFTFLFTILLSLKAFSLVHIQAKSLLIKITKPSEGETLYAGPETPTYSINIEGLVAGVDDLAEVQVVLEIIQDFTVIQSTTDTLDDNGSFIFAATVNPKGSQLSDIPLHNERGCGNCHYRASLDLPSKAMLLRVTATTNDGQQASTERHITVDLSGYVIVPILVRLVDSPETALSGLTVQGSTWLYEWRARHPSVNTDENGLAKMRVEALAEAPTRYIFQVLPTIIDGVLYQGVESREMIIPPGATSAEQITLQAIGALGNLNGHFYGSKFDVTMPFDVWAIHLPDGRSHQTKSDDHGKFEFSEIPYGSYLITTDAWDLAQGNLSCEDQTLDFSHSQAGSILLPVRQMNGVTLSGDVVDTKGGPIPFAQTTIEGLRRSQNSLPSIGTWTFFDLPDQPLTLTISAPGYFSLKKTINPSDPKSNEVLSLELERRPETEILEWGKGEVIIPPETDARIDAEQIFIKRGWIWGAGEGEDSFSITTPSEIITLRNASFGLEILDADHAWFYLWDGLATIERIEEGTVAEIHSDEMVVLSPSNGLVPIPINQVIDAAFHSDYPMSLSPVWEKSLVELLKLKLSSFTTDLIQMITFITYIIALLLLVLLPVWALIKWRRNR